MKSPGKRSASPKVRGVPPASPAFEIGVCVLVHLFLWVLCVPGKATINGSCVCNCCCSIAIQLNQPLNKNKAKYFDCLMLRNFKKILFTVLNIHRVGHDQEGNAVWIPLCVATTEICSGSPLAYPGYTPAAILSVLMQLECAVGTGTRPLADSAHGHASHISSMLYATSYQQSWQWIGRSTTTSAELNWASNFVSFSQNLKCFHLTLP